MGHPGGQLILARLLLAGRGIPADPAEAVYWLTRASEQDNANAQYELGLHLEQSGGEAPPGMGAADWYRRASALGHPEAQARLQIPGGQADAPTSSK
jgi:TPR repeat protein